jgi:molecular chaperone GrpE
MFRRSRRVTQPDPHIQDSAPPADAPAAAQIDDTPTAEAVIDPAVVALQAQVQQFREGWQRERAEFANYQKRAERELKASQSTATANAFKAVLPVLDDLERALATMPADLQGNPWTNGVGMILRKFYKVLEDGGVTIIDPTGQPFDPGKHEAIGTDDAPDVESGTVTATMQKGYLVGDRVLRPALVRVAQ